MRERPGVQPGPAGWFLGDGFSRVRGPISHQLIFGVQVELSARKNQPKAIAYTDLLAVGLFSKLVASLPTMRLQMNIRNMSISNSP